MSFIIVVTVFITGISCIICISADFYYNFTFGCSDLFVLSIHRKRKGKPVLVLTPDGDNHCNILRFMDVLSIPGSRFL